MTVPDSTDERMAALIQQLDPPAPFTLDGFRTWLEQHCRRVIRMMSTTMPPGAPSGVWLQADSADFLFYEEQTSAFHQAHIVASLAARILLAGPAGVAVSQQLIPNVDVQSQRLFLGARIGDAVSHSEAEAFALEVLQRSCPFPGDLQAGLLLRHLQPLRSVLLDAVPTAAHAAGPGSPVGAAARLYYAVIEIRDAALALRRDDALAVTAAFPARGSKEETFTPTLEAAADVASVIRKLDMDVALDQQERSTGAPSLTACPTDLCLEASKLIEST
jgi:hypothetical protein